MGERSLGSGTERLVERKVRGGKLFRLRVSLVEGKAKHVGLTGDFFLEPEGGIEVLEEALLEAYLSTDEATARWLIDEAASGLTLTGFSSSDLVEALKEAGGCNGG
jgi:hypothetical protein